MNRYEQCPTETHSQHAEAIVVRHVHHLFERLPMLSGFWLQDDLKLAELSIFTWPGCTAELDVQEEVMQSLIELAAEYPEAVQFMRGRTFARVVH
jgi:hypothetical protein